MQRHPSESLKPLFAEKVFRVCGILGTGGQVEADLSTLPAFFREYKNRVVVIQIGDIYIPAPPGGYMIRVRQTGEVLQSIGEEVAYFYGNNVSEPQRGLMWFPTRQEAEYTIDTYLSLLDSTKFTLESVPYNHILQTALYNTSKWVVTWQPRPVPYCPMCGAINPDRVHEFTCWNCNTVWDGVYCPLSGMMGYCLAECPCWKYELERLILAE